LKRFGVILSLTLLLSACTNNQSVNGSIQVRLIQPAGGHCEYQIAPAAISTLTHLAPMAGSLGQVKYTSLDLGVEDNQEKIIIDRKGFDTIDVSFSKSGNVYHPMDYASLYAASLYWSLEQGRNLFLNLDSNSDILKLVPDSTETIIMHEAKFSNEKTSSACDDSNDCKTERQDVTDNAAYLGYRTTSGGQEIVRNFFLSYPTNEIEDIPLGLNLGVMIHEFTHYISFHKYKLAFIRKAGSISAMPTKTWNTIRAIDEGMADYFGFMATQDPGFLLCSIPGANRDLSISKTLSQTEQNGLETDENHDPHKVGAVIASVLYRIGQSSGSHEDVGKSVMKTMDNMLSCASVQEDGKISFDLATFRDCHLAQLGSRADTARSIYQEAYNGLY
jgi:hypothetical protein